MGQRWQPFAAYNLNRALTPSVQTAFHVLMQQFGLPAISPIDLDRITVPVTLIWGRHDRGTPLLIADYSFTSHILPRMVPFLALVSVTGLLWPVRGELSPVGRFVAVSSSG